MVKVGQGTSMLVLECPQVESDVAAARLSRHIGVVAAEFISPRTGRGEFTSPFRGVEPPIFQVSKVDDAGSN